MLLNYKSLTGYSEEWNRWRKTNTKLLALIDLYLANNDLHFEQEDIEETEEIIKNLAYNIEFKACSFGTPS